MNLFDWIRGGFRVVDDTRDQEGRIVNLEKDMNRVKAMLKEDRALRAERDERNCADHKRIEGKIDKVEETSTETKEILVGLIGELRGAGVINGRPKK